MTKPFRFPAGKPLQRMCRAAACWFRCLRPAGGRGLMKPVSARDRTPGRPRFPATRGLTVVPPIRYRAYRAGDERSIIQGFNDAFHIDRDEAYWRWKFVKHESPLVMLAVDAAGTVQAQFAGVRVTWEGRGKPLPAAQICDLFSRRHPRVIEEKVMLRTMRAFHEKYARSSGLALIFGFPNRTALRLHGSLRSSFESVHPVDTYRRKAGTTAAAASFVEVGPPEGDAVDALWEKAASRYRRAAPRNADWLCSRFLDRPDVDDYLYLSRRRADGALAAWMVLRRDNDVLWICDLVWDGATGGDLMDLDAAADSQAMRLGAGELGIWLHGDREAAAVFRGQGWVDRTADQPVRFAMHPYDPAVDPAALYADLYLTMADSDLI